MAIMKEETEKVDKSQNQHNTIVETSVHGMGGEQQTREEAKISVQAEIDNKIAEAVKYANKGDYAEALKRLGSATHTVQDREQHQHKKWKYNSILEAVLKNPIRMLGHWIKDDLLGAKENTRNVEATQRDVIQKFEEQVSEQVFKKTLNFNDKNDSHGQE